MSRANPKDVYFSRWESTGLKFTPTLKTESIGRDHIRERAYSEAVKLPVICPDGSASVNEP